MVEPAGPPSPSDDDSGPPEPLSQRDRRRLLFYALARPSLTTVVLVVVYFLVPLDHVGDISGALTLAAGIGVVLVLGWWQIRKILAAEYPMVQAIEALTTVVAFYLVLFATVYFRMSVVNAASFGAPLTRIDALYFCLVVFATVGFGDIVAVSQIARVAVSVQIVANLVLLALGIRVLSAAVRWRRRHRGDS
ncbi:potassium channel family protein [Rhodococcus zopfii]|uniref:Two pore domain potassium channel family protein n=1 Tax=Rhodococcus zopfii TaxID=43772 RepID=A0ABU3WMX7_9NOCA|nr:two pore domain potassium channel family protein [Rhodococcus zopfii]